MSITSQMDISNSLKIARKQGKTKIYPLSPSGLYDLVKYLCSFTLDQLDQEYGTSSIYKLIAMTSFHKSYSEKDREIVFKKIIQLVNDTYHIQPPDLLSAILQVHSKDSSKSINVEEEKRKKKEKKEKQTMKQALKQKAKKQENSKKVAAVVKDDNVSSSEVEEDDDNDEEEIGEDDETYNDKRKRKRRSSSAASSSSNHAKRKKVESKSIHSSSSSSSTSKMKFNPVESRSNDSKKEDHHKHRQHILVKREEPVLPATINLMEENEKLKEQLRIRKLESDVKDYQIKVLEQENEIKALKSSLLGSTSTSSAFSVVSPTLTGKTISSSITTSLTNHGAITISGSVKGYDDYDDTTSIKSFTF
jgi:hypothetical protein